MTDPTQKIYKRTKDPMVSADHPMRARERRRFRVDSQKVWHDHPLTQRVSERRQFISSKTDHEAKPMTQREWNMFNYSMNKNLDIGLDEKTLRMLSRMDQALADVPRFIGVRAMPYTKMDSTAAHTKQVMNNVQYMFERAFGDRGLTREQNQFRRDALLGAWVHDMGEITFELTTANDVFNIKDPKDKEEIKSMKDALEDEIFAFSCELSLKEEETKDQGLLLREMWNLRNWAAGKTPPPWKDDQSPAPDDKVNAIKQRIHRMEKGIEEIRGRLQLPKDPSQYHKETKDLIAIYNRTEVAAKPSEKNFLNTLVKTIESVEGQRYFQRKTADSSTADVTRLLNPEALAHLPYDLQSDHEIVQSCRRSEQRIPQMFAQASNDFEKKLAAATASYTYRSIARQFLPHDYDHVALAPEIIDRQPEPDHKKPEFKGKELSLPEIRTVRERELAAKRVEMGKQKPGSYDVRYLTREQVGILYRAAEKAALRKENGFVPQTPSLIEYGRTADGQLTNPVPKALQVDIREVEAKLKADASPATPPRP